MQLGYLHDRVISHQLLMIQLLDFHGNDAQHLDRLVMNCLMNLIVTHRLHRILPYDFGRFDDDPNDHRLGDDLRMDEKIFRSVGLHTFGRKILQLRDWFRTFVFTNSTTLMLTNATMRNQIGFT